MDVLYVLHSARTLHFIVDINPDSNNSLGDVRDDVQQVLNTVTVLTVISSLSCIGNAHNSHHRTQHVVDGIPGRVCMEFDIVDDFILLNSRQF